MAWRASAGWSAIPRCGVTPSRARRVLLETCWAQLYLTHTPTPNCLTHMAQRPKKCEVANEPNAYSTKSKPENQPRQTLESCSRVHEPKSFMAGSAARAERTCGGPECPPDRIAHRGNGKHARHTHSDRSSRCCYAARDRTRFRADRA